MDDKLVHSVAKHLLESYRRMPDGDLRTVIEENIASVHVQGFRRGKAPIKLAVPILASRFQRSTLMAHIFLSAWSDLQQPLIERARALCVPEFSVTEPPLTWPYTELQLYFEQLEPLPAGLARDDARLAVLLEAYRFEKYVFAQDKGLAPQKPEAPDAEDPKNVPASEAPPEEQVNKLDPWWERIIAELDALALEHPAFTQLDAFAAEAKTRHEKRRHDEAARSQQARQALEQQWTSLLRDHTGSLEYLELSCTGWSVAAVPAVRTNEALEALQRLDSILVHYGAARQRVQQAKTRAERVPLDREEELCAQQARELHEKLSSLLTPAAPPPPPPPAAVAPVPALVSAAPPATEPLTAQRPKAEAPAAAPQPAAEPLEPAGTPPGLSEDLTSWESFRAARWMPPGRTRTEPAPWRRADFGARLETAFTSELLSSQPRFWKLYLLAATAHNEGLHHLPVPEEVRELATLWSEPAMRPAMRKPQRTRLLEKALVTGERVAALSWRARLFLEAACPSREAPLARGEAALLVESAGFKSKDLEVVLTAMLDFAGYGEDSIDRFRTLIPHEAVTPTDPRVVLEQKRRDFKALVKTRWNAGGGKLQRSHCRKVWSEFIHQISPLLHKLYPVPDGGLERWKPGELSGEIARMTELHTSLADRGGALREDRVQMDKLAATFAREAAEIDTLMQHLHHRHTAVDVSPRGDKLPVEALRRLLKGDMLSGDEEFFRLLLVRSVHPKPQEDTPDPLALPFQAICAWPELLLTMPPLEGPPGAPVTSVLDVTDSRLAAALLMEPPSAVEPGEGVTPLIEALENPSRQHLLLRVVAQLPGSMRERTHVQGARGLEQLHDVISRLSKLRLELDELASPLNAPLSRICREAESLLEPSTPSGDPGAAPLNLALMKRWLESVEHEAAQARNTLVKDLRAEALSLGGEKGESVKRALDLGRYAMARFALTGDLVATVSERRVTLWRHDAMVRFPDASRTLREVGVQLLPRWLEGIQGSSNASNQDRAVRAEFARSFLGELYEASHKQQNEVSLLCSDIRKLIDQRGLNPSYLPQLSRFRALVVPSVNVSPAATHFVQAAASAAATHRDHLVVLLAPGITSRVRQSLIEELASRKLTAAVFDDVDMCRLLNPGGQRPNGLLGVLELLLEQQRWSAVSPFGRHEGQHVHLEMYVGRGQEARDLAFSADHSRLFSGRKMGKSALLRFVESRYDGQSMPNGSLLRVIYVSAVGIEQASAMVDRIIEALATREQAAWLSSEGSSEESPHARLERVIRRYLTENPKVSLLLVLDEADIFVEQELEEYEEHREACLSFFMRSRLMEGGVWQGLPRVRFVFTGYRVTNTSEGAWGNWGKVLRLEPLQLDDAAGLVAGPLARLGIDATEQSSVIAHRCGYQPAVILQFGERLLAKLEERYPAKLRLHQKPVVTPQDVVSTFEDVQVQEEIRAVAKNNFQGNPAGRVVFYAVLNEFLLRSPTEPLTDAEARLRHRLEQLEGDDWSWLRPEGETVEGELSRHLRDMVDRQLLLSRRGPAGQSEYLLRFPHHLTVLAPLAREEVMRADIRALRQARTAERAHRSTQALLGRHSLQEVRGLMETPPDPELLGVPVVATLWQPELFAGKGREGALLARGLFDRLGMDQTMVLDARPGAAALEKQLQPPGKLALLGVSWAEVPELLVRYGLSRPAPLLVGGVDLLRGVIQPFGPLQRLAPTEVLFELHAVGRLGRGALSWWFERTRGINFAEAGAMDLILEHTSGIPLLVAELDRLLMLRDPEGSGMDVSDTLLRELLAKVEQSLPLLARQLSKGPPSQQLTRRELSLLRMASEAARVSPESTLGDKLSEYWPILREDLGASWSTSPDFREADAEDTPALTVLLETGLLPVHPDTSRSMPLSRLAPLASGDALMRLVKALPAG